MLAVRSLIRKETRGQEEPLNIITFSFDYDYESMLAQTGHNLYYWTSGYDFSWGVPDEQTPKNFIKMLPDKIPNYVDFDLILWLKLALAGGLALMPVCLRIGFRCRPPFPTLIAPRGEVRCKRGMTMHHVQDTSWLFPSTFSCVGERCH